MSNLSCPIPENINPLYATNFIFSVHKLPKMTYFIQDVTLPDISLGEALYATPLSDIPVPGDKPNFGNLTFSFTIDESFKNYAEISTWILALGYPENHEQFSKFIRDQEGNLTEHLRTVSDATLGILDSSNQPIATYTFVDCFPISLSGFEYSSTETDARTIKATASFAFNYFYFRTK